MCRGCAAASSRRQLCYNIPDKNVSISIPLHGESPLPLRTLRLERHDR